MPELPDRQVLDQINQQCYDACYNNWDRFPFPHTLPDWIHRYHPHKDQAYALDIGSGTGRLALWLQEHSFRVLCLDPSKQMVKICESKGLHCIQTTFQEFSGEDNSFSLIVSCLSLIHIPKEEWPTQLEKMHRLLKPKGVLILACLEGQDQHIQKESSGFSRFFAYTSSNELCALLKPHFKLLNFLRESGSPAYILFAFQKKDLI